MNYREDRPRPELAAYVECFWRASDAPARTGGIPESVSPDDANGRTVSFEFFRIEASAGGTTYWASPRGKPPTPFRMVSSADRRAVFENPNHDFPTRILYWLTEDGALHAKIEGTRGGKPASEEWSWRRTR